MCPKELELAKDKKWVIQQRLESTGEICNQNANWTSSLVEPQYSWQVDKDGKDCRARAGDPEGGGCGVQASLESA